MAIHIIDVIEITVGIGLTNRYHTTRMFNLSQDKWIRCISNHADTLDLAL